jgi:hypothetical protein
MDYLGAWLEGKALFRHQSRQESFEMSHCRDTCVQYEESLCDHFLSVEVDNWNLKRMSALRYGGDIDDYMTQKTYYNTKFDIKVQPA